MLRPRRSCRLSSRSTAEIGAIPLRKHILFVCSQNKLRSPTAEQLYSVTPGLDVASAGLNHGAVVPVCPELLEWADRVFVMEAVHRERLARKFREHMRDISVVCLEIPDDFEFMEPRLLQILEQKLTPYLGPPVPVRQP